VTIFPSLSIYIPPYSPRSGHMGSILRCSHGATCRILTGERAQPGTRFDPSCANMCLVSSPGGESACNLPLPPTTHTHMHTQLLLPSYTMQLWQPYFHKLMLFTETFTQSTIGTMYVCMCVSPVCMYICMCMYVCMYVMYVYVGGMCICIYMYVCMYVCSSVKCVTT